MTRHLRRLVVGIACFALLSVVPSAVAIPPGHFCDNPQAVVGQGAPTQAAWQTAYAIQVYQTLCPAAAGRIAFTPTSDQRGIDAMILRQNPFAASDYAMSTTEKVFAENDTTALRGRQSLVAQIPVLVNGISVGYNLGGCAVSSPLRLRASTLALVYTGAVTKWNDPTLTVDNPSLANCPLTIRVAIRRDITGATLTLKDYLGHGNPAFVALKDRNLAGQWPPALVVNCQGTDEQGMVDCLGDPGAIGYLSYASAANNGIASAALENLTGQFLAPGDSGSTWPTNCPAAANSPVLAQTPSAADWSQLSIVDQPSGYAMCAFSFEFAFQRMFFASGNLLTPGQVRNVYDYLTTLLSNQVQGALPQFGFAPLPPGVLAQSRTGVDSINFN